MSTSPSTLLHERLEAALYAAAMLTFEQLGFMFAISEQEVRAWDGDAPARDTADAPDVPEPPDATDSVEAVAGVPFWGPVSGRLEVVAAGGLLPALAANMLGEDAPPSRETQRDALGEVANVICGNALPAIAGAAAVFRLGPPQVIDGAPRADAGRGGASKGAGWGAEAEALEAAVHLTLDAGRASVRLFLAESGRRAEDAPP
jgi:hypothetical protein